MVIETVSSALVLLQRAFAARSLYAAGHPAVRASEREAFSRIAAALEQDGDISVAFVNGRVLVGSEPLPTVAAGANELRVALHRCGADRLTLRRGLAPEELASLLDVLTRGGESAERDPGPHVEFGHVAGKMEEEAAKGDELRPSADRIARVHAGIDEDRDLDLETLDGIVRSIAAVVSEHSGSLLPLLETKRHDEYTFVHTTNVAVLSGAMAEVLGFEKQVARDVTIAALLHDVGKRRVPDAVLNKRGSLDPDELAIVRRHPLDGARMLLGSPGVPRLAPIVAFEHHIRVDGSGYPAPPAGWRLNVASRIVQIADVYDALRTHRPYSDALPPAEIRGTMLAQAGAMFDAHLLDLFFRRVVDIDAGVLS
ncbi:MAG: HD-GYP domain-containing protein [Candidatus Eiseniibacteriota bacterium]